MDVVITYVNITDRFKEQYSKYVKKELEENRFRSYDTLELQVKGIRKYLPYIENIFIVVSELEQVQGLDLSDCKIITHDQIIPQKYLPCFNSCTIEMFLHKIPGLNEQFLYFNDDIFVIDNIPSSYWFKDNKPCLCPQVCDFNSEDTNIYHKNLYNSTQLIAKDLKFINKYNHKYIKQSHSIRPFLKSTCTKIFNKHIFEIFNTVTRTRHSKNFNMSLFNDYDYLSLNYIPCERNYSYFENDNIDNIINCINKKENKIICINDIEYIDFNEFKSELKNILESNLEGKEYKRIIESYEKIKNINTIYIKQNNLDIIKYCKNIKSIENGFSICLTAFKTQDYIEECLDSIQKQTYFKKHNNYEIILIIDHCYETLNKVKLIMHNYKNLIVIMLNNNVGTYIASNTAMSIAKYNWLVRFDTDDIMCPNMIETIAKNTYNYDIIQYKLKSFSTDGTKFLEYNDFAKGSIAIRKEIFDYYGGYRPWICSGDYELLVRLSNLRINQIDKQLFNYRRTLTCLTKNKKTNGKSLLRKEYNNFIKNEILNNDHNIIECKTSSFTIIKKDTIIVNITTYPARDNFLYKALKYFDKQTLKPDKIILWLSETEYDKENLPDTILNCLKENLLTDILFINKNIYCHKRHECFKYFNYAFNIFIDDDIYYPLDFVEKLVYYSKLYNVPTSYFGKNMEYINTSWSTNNFKNGPDIKNRYYGGLSCIPPYKFPIESFNYEKERDIICPKCDESWLQMWFIKNNINVYNINEWKLGTSPFELIEDTQKISMWNENKQIKNDILKKVNNIARCIVFLNIEDKIKILWPKLDIIKACDGKYNEIKRISI